MGEDASFLRQVARVICRDSPPDAPSAEGEPSPRPDRLRLPLDGCNNSFKSAGSRQTPTFVPDLMTTRPALAPTHRATVG